MVNDLAARQNGLHVGTRVRLYAYSAAQVNRSALTGAVERLPAPRGPSFRVRVAAICVSLRMSTPSLPWQTSRVPPTKGTRTSISLLRSFRISREDSA